MSRCHSVVDDEDRALKVLMTWEKFIPWSGTKWRDSLTYILTDLSLPDLG